MQIKSIKPGSSTILILNYLGMRKRNRKEWTTDLQIAQFFPHKFQRRTKKSSDVKTCLARMLESGFIKKKTIRDVDHYSITELGSTVPFEVAHRIRNSPAYQHRHKFDVLD